MDTYKNSKIERQQNSLKKWDQLQFDYAKNLENTLTKKFKI